MSRGTSIPTRRLAGTLLVLAAVALAGCYPESLLPRMRNQHSIKPHEAATPAMPDGVVPFDQDHPPLAQTQRADLTNPIDDTPASRELGRQYYADYCLMCHGDDGRGDTQVGGGYIPKPTDLSSRAVQSQTDAELFLAMVRGRGHEDKNTGADVLAYTVPRERRWHIVHFLRTLE